MAVHSRPYIVQPLRELVRRGRDILRNEGLAELISRAWLFLHKPLFYYVSYYIYENNPEALPEVSKPEGLSFKVTRESGLVRYEAYLNGNLAGWSFVALNRSAQKRTDRIPVEVDFAGGQVWVGNTRTFLRYRRRGICTYMKYIVFKEYPRVKWVITKGNRDQQRVHERLGSKIVGEGRYLGLLCWEFRHESNFCS